MEANIELKSSPRAFQDALGAGLPLEAILASILVNFWTSGTPKNRALAVARCYFLLKSPTAPGGPKSTPIWSKIEARRLRGGVEMGSEAVSKRGAISVPIVNLIFMIFQVPKGEPEVPNWRLKSCLKRL